MEQKTLYTAIGRLDRETNGCGRSCPVIRLSGQTYMVDMQEMVVWTALNWRISKREDISLQCDSHYHPKKKTVMALCIALKLNLEQAKDLLARADWAFSPSSKVDLIVQKALIDRQYDIMQLNTVLFKYTNEILGV